VKLLHTAKTRLAPVEPSTREALALAMALDTVAAALRCDRVATVLVVTDDGAAAELSRVGAVVVPDVRNDGLNPAVEHGAAEARRRQPGHAVIALTADVPALKPAELTRVLDAAADHARTVVADASGEGTVALTALPAVALDPMFGPGSLALHARSGAVVLDLDVPGLRRDVDTLDHLRAALRLGCGPRTTAAAAAIVPRPPWQATVRDFDVTTRSGVVLLDDGTALEFDGAAFDARRLRFLRPGQRVRIAVSDDGHRVTAVTLATFTLDTE
jgi:2-phospho-L-lactate guanylyltransferase